MLLIASSRGTVIPSEINGEVNEFFSSQDKVQGQLFLNSTLEKENVECYISIALAKLFNYGNLAWTLPIVPSGDSPLKKTKVEGQVKI